ncbi:CoxG family protein [Metasolibacillus meyeri]|uniref:CoxG family protein n=1 Tax=Metasolibacillus meyeri TaxID=1071052 RepID=UPI000D2FBFAF|nr:SRPBCC family protein [Metasolibacillus meyeri]
MTTSVHQEVIQITKEDLWQFIQDKGRWAVLIPGYLHHELPSAQQMIWVFQGDFGIIQKAVKLQLDETASVEGEKLAFNLVGLSDNINGSGYFEMTPANGGSYSLTGSLTMTAGGFLAAMINPVLEGFVPKTVEALVQAMAQEVSKVNN